MQNPINRKFLFFTIVVYRKKFRIKLSYYINVKENILNSIHFSTVRSLSLLFQQLHLNVHYFL